MDSRVVHEIPEWRFDLKQLIENVLAPQRCQIALGPKYYVNRKIYHFNKPKKIIAWECSHLQVIVDLKEEEVCQFVVFCERKYLTKNVSSACLLKVSLTSLLG